MKRITLTIALIAISVSNVVLHAQTEAEQKAWQAFMSPGEMHKMLASWDGEWNEEITHWMQPGGEGMKSTANCVSKMILGGRYNEQKHTGSFFGMPFEGISTLAYDNGKKIFVNTWVDNMGSGIMILEGTWDAAKKTINLKGKATDPMTGKDMIVRQTVKIVSPDIQVIEMYGTQNGKEFKNMEITLTRKK